MRLQMIVPTVALITLVPAAVLASVRSQDTATPAIASAATPAVNAYAQITSQVFVEGTPAPVRDNELALALVTVPPGAEIAPHSHPGSQFALVAQGELTYTVDTGMTSFRRAAAPADGPWDEITPGETVVLTTGDVVR
ncbi:MAG: cupin domain-containing protein, partial [Thermomicrobiales bacterium]